MNAFRNAQRTILKPISDMGYSAYVVGGFCRDFLLNHENNDIDIATNCPIDVLEKHFNVLGDISKNFSFGIVVIESNGFRYEVAQFRIEKNYTDHRHPDEVHFVSTFKEDAMRRDFSINAIAIDAEDNILDYFNGQEDLTNKILRAVGDPQARFEEDYLRILRAVRFAAAYSFSFEETTEQALRNCASYVIDLAPERIFNELVKMASLGGPKFADAIQIMFDLGILQHILPEIAELNNWEHSPEHHPEGRYVLDHVLAAVRQSESTDPLMNFSVLFHDTGKGVTHNLREKNGKFVHSYFNHDQEGVALINNIADRIRFPNEYREACCFVSANHMKFHKFTELKASKVVALMQSSYFEVLRHASYCDDKSRLHLFDETNWIPTNKRIEEIRERYFQEHSPLKYVNGKKVMELTNVSPGPKLGQIISKTNQWIMNTSCSDFKKIDQRIIQLSKSF